MSVENDERSLEEKMDLQIESRSVLDYEGWLILLEEYEIYTYPETTSCR